ncbi:tRNA (adenosine(37)-N6)-dimethylallyltransferase MiaA [Pirellulaceae bacterium SH501]
MMPGIAESRLSDWLRPPLEDAIYLTGPTASGKSRLAVEVARLTDAEILSVDSMAVYREMNIGTAKPTADARKEVPHHLIDLVDPTDDYSVSQFVIDAHEKAKEIKSRGKRVLLVGGTPLYLKSLFCGMFLGPEADWDFRQQVEEDVAVHGLDALRRRLEQADPLSAHKILPNDIRRMTRALEVVRATGVPLSHWQSQFERIQMPRNCRAYVLNWDRSIMHQRVNQRVDEMFSAGLLDEVRSLVEKHGKLGRTASQAVGYKEPIEFLNGLIDQAMMIEQVKAHTRQFVRRQEIWFRSMPNLTKLPLQTEADLKEVAHQIANEIKAA